MMMLTSLQLGLLPMHPGPGGERGSALQEEDIQPRQRDMEVDWPLQIFDNAGALHEITLRPGEMVWYESARLLHGRPEPLAGDYYDNLFIHFSPTHWYTEEVEVGQT